MAHQLDTAWTQRKRAHCHASRHPLITDPAQTAWYDTALSGRHIAWVGHLYFGLHTHAVAAARIRPTSGTDRIAGKPISPKNGLAARCPGEMPSPSPQAPQEVPVERSDVLGRVSERAVEIMPRSRSARVIESSRVRKWCEMASIAGWGFPSLM